MENPINMPYDLGHKWEGEFSEYGLISGEWFVHHLSCSADIFPECQGNSDAFRISII